MNATHEEEWRVVPNTNGAYEVSNRGNLRSVSRYVGHRCGVVLRRGQPIKSYLLKSGYLQVRIVFADGTRTTTMHRLVCETFHGPPPPGQEVRHLNGINSDNRAQNLQWGTRAENVADGIQLGSIRNGRPERKRCPRGHRLLEPNLRLGAALERGHRICRSCEYGRTYAKHTNQFTAQELSDKFYRERFQPPEDN